MSTSKTSSVAFDPVEQLKNTLIQKSRTRPDAGLDAPPNVMTFTQLVVREYADRREVYQAYIDMERNAERHRKDPGAAAARLAELFADRPYLIYPAIATVIATVISPVDSGQATDHAKGRQLGVTDAIAYLDAVKADPDRHQLFLGLMKQFQSGEIDVTETAKRAAKLFHDRPELIEGFNTFLPAGYNMQSPDSSAPRRLVTVRTPSDTFMV